MIGVFQNSCYKYTHQHLPGAFTQAKKNCSHMVTVLTPLVGEFLADTAERLGSDAEV